MGPEVEDRRSEEVVWGGEGFLNEESSLQPCLGQVGMCHAVEETGHPQ